MPPSELRPWSRQQQVEEECVDDWSRPAPQLQMADPPALGIVVFDKEELDKLEDRGWDKDQQDEDEYGKDLQEARAFDESLWGPQEAPFWN